MKKKGIILFAVIAGFLMLNSVLAITGSIGNARMIINAETGQIIEKSILVKNVNDETISIKITASGDLEKYVVIKDSEFELKAGEEKKAEFTIKALEQGTTETQINIKFTPEEGSGVGLSSTVIVVAKGETVEEDENTGNSISIISWITGERNNTSTNNQTSGNNETATSDNFTKNYILIGLLFTTAILVIFIILLGIYSSKIKKKKNKETTKPKKKSETE